MTRSRTWAVFTLVVWLAAIVLTALPEDGSPGHLPDEPEMGLRTELSGRGREVEVGTRNHHLLPRASESAAGADLDLLPHRYADPPDAHVHTSGTRTATVIGDPWSALAHCESTGNPRAVSASGKYRGLFQFSMETWRSVGETGDPIDASPEVQLAAAQRLQARSGWGQWPQCASRLGLR